jgi:hypothetical protein
MVASWRKFSLVGYFRRLPVAIWNGGDGRLEAVGMVAPVTTVAQQQRVLVLPAVTELGKQQGELKSRHYLTYWY